MKRTEVWSSQSLFRFNPLVPISFIFQAVVTYVICFVSYSRNFFYGLSKIIGNLPAWFVAVTTTGSFFSSQVVSMLDFFIRRHKKYSEFLILKFATVQMSSFDKNSRFSKILDFKIFPWFFPTAFIIFLSILSIRLIEASLSPLMSLTCFFGSFVFSSKIEVKR